jgi:tetratricopeptide (TPR) repeat protein
MPPPSSGDQEQGKQGAEASFQFGVQVYHNSELEQAAQSFREAAQSFALGGDLKRAGDSHAMIADIERQQGLLEQSISSYRHVTQLYRDAGHPSDEAESLLAMGHVERQRGHLDQSRETYIKARRLYQSLHQVQGLGHVALALGHVELPRAHLDAAALRYQEAIDYYRAAADSAEIDALSSLANVERLLGNFSQAEAYSRMALEKYRLSADVFGTIVALAELGHIYLDEGRLDQASQALIEALNLARGAEDEEVEGDASLGLAEVDLRQNRFEQALLEAQAALEAYTVGSDDLGIAEARRLLAAIHLQGG